MTPVWSPEAIEDLASLRAYIEQDDKAAALRVALHIVRNVETLLPNNPEMGGPAGSQGRMSSSYLRRRLSCRTVLSATRSRFYGCFTSAADGRKPFKSAGLPNRSGRCAGGIRAGDGRCPCDNRCRFHRSLMRAS